MREHVHSGQEKVPGNTGNAVRGRAVRTVTALLLIVCLLAGCGSSFPNSFQDYASAGAYCQKQIAERNATFSLTCLSSDYNPILGPGDVLKKVVKEAIVHTGDPTLGDHLALGVNGYSLRYSVSERNKDGKYDLTMTVEPEYTTTSVQEEELKTAVDRILGSLHIDGASDYEKALAIYRYLCDNVVYDHAHLNDTSYLLQYSAYAAATQGTAVCAGIADLFYCLANAAGLDARICTNDTHSWNFVRVDGKYYYADATWDLGKSEAEYAYFLKGSADFERHRGNITFGPDGFSNLLVGSDLSYEFSAWAYGYDPYKF